MEPLVIESEAMRVAVLPAFGARVVSLLDKRSAREWMFEGGQTSDTGEDAVYGADAAVGWDECFPTVSPWDASQTAWQRRLRDHGDIWGRPWTVDAHDARSLTTTYATAEFAFSRSLSVDGPVLTGEAQRVQFLGTFVRYIIDAPEASRPVIIDTPAFVEGVSEGSPVTFGFSPTDAIAFGKPA